MKNSIKIFLFLFVMAVMIFLLKPWETSDKLISEDSGQDQAKINAPAGDSQRGRSRSPASVGNPGEASGLSIRE
ncbi:MAG: hypothetical protein IPM97_07265 [Bdellovibrionaceae bacterium]|nr:hypothetical protein [Pseudobdellovibrionaceae bacterium]